MPESVTDRTELRPNPEMGLIGYLIAAGVLLLLLPVLPILAVVRLYGYLTEGGRGTRPE